MNITSALPAQTDTPASLIYEKARLNAIKAVGAGAGGHLNLVQTHLRDHGQDDIELIPRGFNFLNTIEVHGIIRLTVDQQMVFLARDAGLTSMFTGADASSTRNFLQQIGFTLDPRLPEPTGPQLPAADPAALRWSTAEFLEAQQLARTNSRTVLRRHSFSKSEVVRVAIALNANTDRDILELIAKEPGTAGDMAKVRLATLDHQEKLMRGWALASGPVRRADALIDPDGITVVRHLTGSDIESGTVGHCVALVAAHIAQEQSEARVSHV